MPTILPLLLALSIDGEAARGHASALAALGPHPLGSPRGRAAAEFVAAQFRAAEIQEVRLQEFERAGARGTNVIGVLRAPGPEFLVVGAHHDTVAASPGAYDDGGGVGVLIEVARVLARQPTRPRTVMFVSWDGEEALQPTRTPGSRAYIEALGSSSRDLVAALVIEMSGWRGGTPALHPIPYADPLRPGGYVVTPGWVMAAVESGARQAGAPLVVGDPWLAWLYQPAVRTFRAGYWGDDLSFLQAKLPAVFVSDSSFTAFYPWYHQPSDTADKLDAGALARMGASVLGAIDGLGRAARGAAVEPSWFAAAGQVASAGLLLAVGAASLVPLLVAAVLRGGLVAPVRVLQAAAFGLLLWRHPVPALWTLLLPNLLVVSSARAARLLALAPALALLGLGAAAWWRGFAWGVWLAPWEIVLLGLALFLAWLRPGRPSKRAGGSRRTGRRRTSRA
jgi:hypothetical protein